MKNLLLIILLSFGLTVGAQVAINTDGSTPDNSAMLDVKSTSQGLLIPRLTMAQRNAIISPANGLMIYQTDNIPGFYYNSATPASPAWVMAGTGSGWGLSGNSGTSSYTNFIGTTDGQPLIFKINNQKAGKVEYYAQNTSFGLLTLNVNTGDFNTALGYYALKSNNNGDYNTAVGSEALRNNIDGNSNTAIGNGSLSSNIIGGKNTAIGELALNYNNTGDYNSATGFCSLFFNTSGSENTAYGHGALYSNKSNNQSTAIGYNAMINADNRTTGRITYNTAIGYEALRGSGTAANNTGQWNTAAGYQSMLNNTSGSGNTATGVSSLLSNTTGSNNAVYGGNTLATNTTGQENAAFGNWAMELSETANYNTACGSHALRSNLSGNFNTAVGQNALYFITSGGYNTGLGENVYPISGILNNWTGIGSNAGSSLSISNSVELGNTSVTRIQGQVAMSLYSDERIKDNIVANVPGLDFILKLRPVTYNLNIHRQNEILYKGQKNTEDWPGKYDIEKVRMTGFIAQEVAKASADIGYDFNGVDKPETADGLFSLRYTEFVMPLVKAVQELKDIVDSQKKEIDELKAKVESMQTH